MYAQATEIREDWQAVVPSGIVSNSDWGEDAWTTS
jgi:hypothetical protein